MSQPNLYSYDKYYHHFNYSNLYFIPANARILSWYLSVKTEFSLLTFIINKKTSGFRALDELMLCLIETYNQTNES
jgi:hypothetical protein